MSRLRPIHWAALIAAAFVFAQAVWADRDTAPIEFITVPTPPVLAALGEEFKVIRLVVNPDHGCLFIASLTGLGSPKHTLGCW